jgi:hypothetical protein
VAWLANRALVEGQQIVVPIAIGMGLDIRGTAGRTNNSHVGALAVPRIDDKERVGFGVDALDNLLPRPDPRRRVPNMSDVLVRALGVGLSDTGDLAVSHRPSRTIACAGD